MTARKSATSSPPVPKEYVAVKALSIMDASYLPGDSLSEESIQQLPTNRLKQLVSGGWLRPQN